MLSKHSTIELPPSLMSISLKPDLTIANLDCALFQTLGITHLLSNISESEYSEKSMETESPLDIVENWGITPETRELSLFTSNVTNLTPYEMTESLEYYWTS